MATETGRTGGCLCGAVRFTAAPPLRDVVVCHCNRCRRQHGHVGAYTEVNAADLVVASGDTLTWYVADDRERGFCRRCGASLFWRRSGSGRISIAAGTLDGPTGLRTAAHIFVADRGDYYEITDDLPRFPAGSTSRRP
jgi:hypothetical protein